MPILLDVLVAGFSSPGGNCSSAEKPCDCNSLWTSQRQNEFAADLCHLFVACNFVFNTVENPQMQLFFAKWLPQAKLPSRRALSSTHLDNAVTTAEAHTWATVLGKYATGQSDGWKNITKTSLLTSTMNVLQLVHGFFHHSRLYS